MGIWELGGLDEGKRKEKVSPTYREIKITRIHTLRILKKGKDREGEKNEQEMAKCT